MDATWHMPTLARAFFVNVDNFQVLSGAAMYFGAVYNNFSAGAKILKAFDGSSSTAPQIDTISTLAGTNFTTVTPVAVYCRSGLFITGGGGGAEVVVLAVPLTDAVHLRDDLFADMYLQSII